MGTIGAGMDFVKTDIFDNKLKESKEKDLEKNIKGAIKKNPKAGVVIPKAGGARKLRMKTDSSGQRGGYRVIYYHVVSGRVYLIFLLNKKEKSDLSEEEKDAIKEFTKKVKETEKERRLEQEELKTLNGVTGRADRKRSKGKKKNYKKKTTKKKRS